MVTRLEVHAEQLAALGHPVRLAIVRQIVQGSPDGTPAGEIQAKLDIPASTLSHHLDRLASSGLLTRRSEGTFIYYAAQFETMRRLTDFLWDDCCKGGRCC